MIESKLLISDIDGTLVRSDKTLDRVTIAAVAKLGSVSLPMTLISARPPSGMIWIVEALDLPGPFGAFNGGTLFMRDGRVIEQHCIDRQVAETAIEMLRESGITVWAFAGGKWFSTDDTNPHTGHEIKSAGLDPIITADFTRNLDRIDKIVGVSDDHERLIDLEGKMITAVSNGATIARSQLYYLDVTAPVANKGDGIAFLANAFHVKLAEVVVIGDQANDLPMFARAGYSVAMGQAPKEVKAKATTSTTSNDENGVAHAIETIILPSIMAKAG